MASFPTLVADVLSLAVLEVAHLVQGMEVKARVLRTLLAPVQGEAAP
jgi:hypothetical protein